MSVFRNMEGQAGFQRTIPSQSRKDQTESFIATPGPQSVKKRSFCGVLAMTRLETGALTSDISYHIVQHIYHILSISVHMYVRVFFRKPLITVCSEL